MKLNLPQLRRRCLMSFEEYAKEGDLRKSKDGRHIVIDRGSKILAVAHLDSVGDARHFEVTRLENKLVVFNEQLDDRLGAYLLLDYLPQLGLEYDVLLTEGEEKGRSTAGDFKASHAYNWAFSFDRAGTDVVMYQFEDAEMRKLLKDYGLQLNMGLYSDIGWLDDLGVKCFNFGTGYYDNHSMLSHMVVADTREMVDVFSQFYVDLAETEMPHVEDYTGYYQRGNWSSAYNYTGYARGNGWEDWDDRDGAREEFYCCYECKDWVPAVEYDLNSNLCQECKREAEIISALEHRRAQAGE